MEYLVIILICLFIILLISIIYSHIKIDVNYFLVKSNKIDTSLKIMFLSDLHNRNIISKLESIIEKETPSIIVCGGDMVNEYIRNTKNFFKLIDILNNYKTYYVFGNHEEKMSASDILEFNKKLNLTNIILLNNDSVKLSDNVKIYGLDSEIDKYKYRGKLGLDKEYIVSKLGELDSNLFNILIAHNPLEFNSYIDYGCDLVLSGHVHGGLIRLPFIGGLLSPDYTFLPKYYQGRTKEKTTTMIVSRGLGYSKRIPFRVNNPAEVVIINLEHDYDE